MKKILLYCLWAVSFGVKAQTELKRQTGLEATIISLSVNHQQPLAKHLLADISLGFGSSSVSSPGHLNYYSGLFSPFGRVSLKWFYNRTKRLNNAKSLDFNHGNFLGFQNKMVFIGQRQLTMLNELHWGVQTQLSNRFLLQFHLGLGYHQNLAMKQAGGFYPAIGLNFRYVLF